MPILIAFLTVLLVLTCVFLIFLVLVQLPKKEAGAGMAFGGGTADALLGAGSGSAVSRFTGYVVGAFFVLTLALALLRAHENNSKSSAITEELRKASGKKPATVLSPMVSTNLISKPATNLTVSLPAATNKVAAPSTNASGNKK